MNYNTSIEYQNVKTDIVFEYEIHFIGEDRPSKKVAYPAPIHIGDELAAWWANQNYIVKKIIHNTATPEIHAERLLV